MIDRSARDHLAGELKGLIEALVTTDNFTDLDLHRAEDSAVAQIWTFGWGLYSDDIGERFLVGRHAVVGERRKMAERSILFLQTDLPYEWPLAYRGPTPGGAFWLGCFALVGLPLGVIAVFLLADGEFKLAATTGALPIVAGSIGSHWLITRSARAEEERRFWASGDRDVWPFLRRSDYDAVRRSQPI